MSDVEEDSYDPDKDVPPVVNIVVPIACAVIFILVLFLLYRTKKEIPVETLERWAEKIPFISKYLSTDWTEEDDGDSNKPPVKDNPKPAKPRKDKCSEPDEKTKFAYDNSGFERYDTLKSIDASGGGDKSTISSTSTGFFHNQGGTVCFESNV